jgi:hypothetical protein
MGNPRFQGERDRRPIVRVSLPDPGFSLLALVLIFGHRLPLERLRIWA